MSTRLRLTVCALAATLTGAAAQAAFVTNGSFEQNNVTGGTGFCYLSPACVLTGWSGNAVAIGAASGAWGGPSAPAGYVYGSQLVGLQQGSYVEQALALTPGSYTLGWADSGRQFYGAAQYQVLFDNQVLGSYATQPGEAWGVNNLSFTAAGPGTLRFQGIFLNADTTAFIDGVNLTANRVPEPAALGLVALALGGALFNARRRRTTGSPARHGG